MTGRMTGSMVGGMTGAPTRRKGGGFDWYPNRLFADGDILLWYDPSDLSTMFQDTAGTSPVTADGQSVALHLDKGQWGGKTLAQVLAAATEVVSDPGFDDAGDWTVAVATVSGSAANWSSAASGSYVQMNSGSPAAGKWCKATIVVASKSAGDLRLTDSTSSAIPGPLALAVGVNEFFFQASGLPLRIRAIGTTTGVVTSFSVKEIPGYHRTQATGTSMPKYKTGPNPAAAENSPELVTNGGFDINVTGWTAGNGAASHSSGALLFTKNAAIGAGLVISSGITTVVGEYYRVKATYTRGTTTKFGYLFASNNSDGSSAFTQSTPAKEGLLELIFQATATTTYIGPRSDVMEANSTFTVDNISVREIPASAPYIHWLLYDGTDDSTATPTIPFGTVTSDGAARRNLLTEPDKFDHTTWTKQSSGVAVTANAATAPDGTMTADRATWSSDNISLFQTAAVVAGDNTFSIYVKGTAGETVGVWCDAPAGGTLDRQTVTLDGTWQRVTRTVNAIGSGNATVAVRKTSTTADVVDVWGAQLELGSTATDFQNIGTDEIAICTGVTKSSDAAAGAAAELSANSSTTTQTFGLFAPSASATAAYSFRVRGSTTGAVPVTPTDYAAPVTNVVTGTGKIGTDAVAVRIDGEQVATGVGDLGTGNFGDNVLNFGRRGGSTLPFNGREYQTVIRSRLLSASELSRLETFVAAKSGVIL